MIVVMSLWRNDANRNLRERAAALLSKTALGREIAFLWAVGDSSDSTEDILRDIARQSGQSVTVVNVDTGIVGEDAPTRRIRLSQSATQMFSALGSYFEDAKFACLHESDLVSSPDVVTRLLYRGGGSPCAGWPVINLTGTPQFYDIWAYRHTDGRLFVEGEERPMHVFRVSCFGSVWVAPAPLVVGRVLKAYAIRELCAQWEAEGYPMYCAPSVLIEQPVGLWVPTCLT